MTDADVVEATLAITVLNEAENMRGFLESLSRLAAIPQEIVVVDGGSHDGTPDIVRAWEAPSGCTVRVLSEPGVAIAQGRNIAIRSATFERILVTDAGTEVEPRWAEMLLAAFDAQFSPDIVSGFFFPTGATLLQRAIAFTVTPSIDEIDPKTFLPSSRSIAFTRSAWEAVGGYPEWLDYCEDLVFDISLLDAGLRFAFAGEARVSWSARPTIPQFMKQYYRYARGDGKASLWPRRHLARYAAYSAGVGLLAASRAYPGAFGLLAVGFSGYVFKYGRRIVGRRKEFGNNWLAALFLVPVIVVSGDVAKMAGYPAGLRWRQTQGRFR